MSTLFSAGHSRSPMPRLVAVARAFAEKLPQPIYVQRGHTKFDCKNIQTIDFLSQDQFRERLAEADVIILHGGGVSILEANNLGKVPVVMPRRRDLGEHIDDHQVSLCRHFAKAGKVAILDKTEDLLLVIAEAKALEARLDHQSIGQRMSELVSLAIQTAAKK